MTAVIERRFLPKEMRSVDVFRRAEDAEDDQPRGIRGTAAVFFREDDPDGTQYLLWQDVYERIMPGAFDAALERPDDVRCLQNHDPRMLLGRSTAGTLRLSVDDDGLLYEVDTPDTTAGRDTLVSLERGDMTGSSFSFVAEKVSWREETDDDGKTIWYREVEQVRLFDVSPVTFPAYTGTAAGVRAMRSAGPGATDSRAASELDALQKELQDFRSCGHEAAAAARLRELQI